MKRPVPTHILTIRVDIPQSGYVLDKGNEGGDAPPAQLVIPASWQGPSPQTLRQSRSFLAGVALGGAIVGSAATTLVLSPLAQAVLKATFWTPIALMTGLN